MPRKLSEFEIECMERRARGQAAWGLYAACVRQNNLNQECADLRESLSGKGLSRAEIEEKVKELIRKKSTGGLYIG